MKCLTAVFCLQLLTFSSALDLNDIKKMRTDPTTLATTPTTTTPTTTTTKPTTTTKTTTTTPTTTTVTTTTTKPVEFSIVDPGAIMIDCPDACPSGWQYYSSKCYKKFTSTGTYTQAISACQALGAELVTIENSAENDALRKAFDTNALVDESRETWIGLKASVTGGSWIWTDGSTASYTNWAPTQPSSASQCVQMITDALSDATYLYQRGGWKTYDCSKTSASYICEQSASG
ncbi:hypothetical protein CRE_05529 [Caenorhabditis remanei]|uniref:C-type lectin domain-containing protein n=2 Tax=Caenorhabditis remanei TaxID=31234 RepID=E3LZS6_CAERE|nr:hypothetical protein CRE_05529 [Caenorhabditis remanei]